MYRWRRSLLLYAAFSVAAIGCHRSEPEIPSVEISEDDEKASSPAAPEPPSEHAGSPAVSGEETSSSSERERVPSVEPSATETVTEGANGSGSIASHPTVEPSSSQTDEGNRSSGPQVRPPSFKTPQQAKSFASKQRSKAKQQAEDGNQAQAYEDALKGWQALQPHLSDTNCRALSDRLLGEIEQYGEQLGSTGHRVIGKPLKIK